MTFYRKSIQRLWPCFSHINAFGSSSFSFQLDIKILIRHPQPPYTVQQSQNFRCIYFWKYWCWSHHLFFFCHVSTSFVLLYSDAHYKLNIGKPPTPTMWNMQCQISNAYSSVSTCDSSLIFFLLGRSQ